MSLSIPRTSEITRTKSRNELVAEREWAQAAERRKNLASKLAHSLTPSMSNRRAKNVSRFASQIKRDAWRNLARETRTA